jgi:hypothetical protein
MRISKNLSTKLLTVAICAVSVVAYAATDLERLNTAIQVLLKPYHSDKTHADFKFTELNIGKAPAVVAKAYGTYHKAGKIDDLTLNIKQIAFDSTVQNKPVALADGSIGINLTKFVTDRGDLNSLIEDAENTVHSIAAELLSEYGEAAIVSAKVTEKKKDAQGNYVSFKGTVGIKMDLSKLPNTIKPEQVPVLAAESSLSVDVFKGIEIKINAQFNPANKWVKDEQGSIRAYAQKLMDQDSAIMNQVAAYLKNIDETVGKFLDGSR